MAILNGTIAADLLAGTIEVDVITGILGNDTLYGGQANDSIDGGDDSDLIFGDRGRDAIIGGAGNDTLVGGTGSLATNDGDEADFLAGNQGDDWLFGNRGNDTLEGGQGNDTLVSGKQADLVNGGEGDDVIYGDLGVSADVTRFDRSDYPANAAPISIVAADIDGDGDNDLVVANPGRDPSFVNPDTGNTVSVLRNNGDGTFAAPISFATGVGPSVAAGDFDRDGDLDLATANTTDDTVSLLRNDGTGNFAAPVSFVAGDRPVINAPADIDGDGDFDLITTNTVSTNLNTAINLGNTLSVLRNDGTGNFAAPEALVAGNGVDAVTADDLDGDGDLDLVAADEGDNTLSVLRNLGGGTFAAAEKFAVGLRPRNAVAADFDRDGDLDLAAPNFGGENIPGSISLLRNNGDGTFAAAVNFATPNIPNSLNAVDLDGDGDLDLVMRHSFFTTRSGVTGGSSISVLRNNGDATFAAAENFPVGNTPRGLVVADLDGIRNSDLATPNFDSDSVTVYLNQAVVADGDTLTGGAGADDFVFNQPGSEGDTITDFQPGVDQIMISAEGFGLPVGAISADQFALGSVAIDPSDRFLYNVGTGILLFDPDGTGVETPTVLVALTGAPNLSIADILAV